MGEAKNWKCPSCGCELQGSASPGMCPSCKQKWILVDVACYDPECSGPGNVDLQIAHQRRESHGDIALPGGGHGGGTG